MALSKIKRRVAASTLLFQQNFNNASDKSPGWAHYKAIIAAVFFLGFAIVLVVAPGRSDFRVAQSLLNGGLPTIGTIERVNVESRRSGKAGTEYITTVDYRFMGPDKQIYRGSSSYTGPKPQPVVPGNNIDVLHDPQRPNISGWRTALQGTEATVHVGVILSMLGILCCLFWLSRYARWMRHRRSLPM